MRFDHAIFLEGFLSREKEDRSKKGGYRGNRRGLINRKGEDQGWQQCVSGRTMGEGRSCDKRRGRGLWSSLKSPFRRRRPFTLRLLKDYLHPSFIDPRHSRDCRLSHSYIYVYMYICMHIYMYRNIWAGFDLVSGRGRKGEGGDPFNKLGELQKRNQILSRLEGARSSKSSFPKYLYKASFNEKFASSSHPSPLDEYYCRD